MANRNVAHAVRVALVTAGAVSAGLYGVTSSAQDSLGEIVVTGSRIVRQDYEATSPVVTISEDVFRLSGEPQIEKILNELPQLVPSVSTASNNPSNGGQANINLRGLGSSRTLVLIDGTRMQPSNVSGIVDLNTIPAGLIQSVEIMTGGASSTYGSDAVAGVVNFHMKRDFEGVRLSAQYGITEESDGTTNAIDALIGGNFADGRGNAVIALGYDTRAALLAGERKIGEVTLGRTLTPTGSGTVPDGGVSWGANTPTPAALNTVFGAYGAAAGAVPPAATIGINTNGTLFSFGRGTAAQPVVNYLGNTADPGYNPLSYSYNFGPVNYLQLPLERRQIAGFARYDLVPEVAEIYTRIMFTTYSADQQLAATPISSGIGTSVPITNSQIPADLRTLLASRATPGANFTLGRRTVEVGPRTQDNGYDIMQGLIGFRGVLPNDWKWDVYGSWGELRNVNIQGGNVSRSRLNSALINPAVFASQGCAAFNPFGVGNITPACARAIAISASNILTTEQTNIVASVTGSLFDMPAGPLQFAVGAEYRENTANFRPDEFLASGDVVGFNAQQPVSGKIDVKEPFIEFAVPLLAGKPFVSYLGLDLGYRRSDYNLAGAVDTYKGALQWRPVDSFQVRAGYNRAIRAPNISDLFTPVQENFPTYADPCNFNSTFRTGPNGAAVAALCTAQGIPASSLPTYTQAFTQARAFVGGNIDLKPEVADTFTGGIAWQSQADSVWARNLSLSVDYYKYEIDDVISSLSVNSIIGRCFNNNGGNPTYSNSNTFCQLFTRDVTFRPDGVRTQQLNLAGVTLEGIDLQIDWGFPLDAVGFSERAGDLTFKLLLTHLLSTKTQETISDPFYEFAGTISQTTASANPDNKAVLSTTWAVGDFTFRWNFRWIDAMRVVNNDAQGSTPTLGIRPFVTSYDYHDFTARWRYNEKYSVTLGVNNLLDRGPPIYTTDSQAGIQSNTDPSTYDTLGRRYFLSLGAKF